ncbi:MAG: hypothetical protein GY724_16580 [Actinomycetia bacterium]|nr:hypothetical protein [Actinomycetes bacterium]MCP4221777.1 hypothetical protein [Actinomycetes bacterium]MCP5032693.1 hypothetical protein [Actinomycetes bacterium]
MTDSDTQTDETDQDHDSLEPSEPSPLWGVGPEVEGETFFPYVKDIVLLLLVVFFGLIAFGIKSVGLGEAGSAGVGSGTIDVTLEEFAINGNFLAPAGDVTLEISNAGTVTHNVVATELGLRTVDLDIGGTATLSLGVLAPGDYELFCDITGHRDSGMVTTLTVVEG